MTKYLGFLSLSAVLLVGCSGDSSTSNAAPAGGANSAGSNTADTSKKSDFKVALLTPGPVNDSGWCALAYDGLQSIKSDLGAVVANKVTKESEIKEDFRTYAQQGFKLVFGHGFEYNDPAIEVAKDFPDTVFVTSGGSKTSKNVGAIRYYLEESFYLAGFLAGKASKSGVVGMVGGPQVPSIESTFKAFDAGAHKANPKITVLKAYTGKNDDVAAAKQVAEQMIGKKADFLIHQANAGAEGVFTACKDANIHAFGANSNQNDDKSGVIAGSALINGKQAFLTVAKLVKDGKFDGNTINLGMDSGSIDFVFNDKLKSVFPADAVTQMEAIKKDIASGKFVVPKDKF